MARFTLTVSILASAFFFLSTNAIQLEQSPEPIAEASPLKSEMMNEFPEMPSPLPEFSPALPVESPLIEMPTPIPEPTESAESVPIRKGCISVEYSHGNTHINGRVFKKDVLCFKVPKQKSFCATPDFTFGVSGLTQPLGELCDLYLNCYKAKKEVVCKK